MKQKYIIYPLFALFSVPVSFAQEAGDGSEGGVVTATEIEAIRIDENIVLTDTDVVITSDGKSIWAWQQSSGTFEYSATDGTMTIAGDIEVGNSWSSFTDQTLTVNLLGSGNTISLAAGKQINLAAVGGLAEDGTLVNTGNTFTLNVASSDAEAPNTLVVDTVRMASGVNYDSDEASTSQSILSFNGNTVLKSVTNTDTSAEPVDRYYTDIFINDTEVNGGVNKLIVRNSNNVLNIDDLSINSAWIDTAAGQGSRYTNIPKAIVDIGGTGNTVNIRWLSVNNFGVDASSVIKVAAGNKVTVGYNWGTYSRIEANMASGLNFKEVYNAQTGELSNGTMFVFEAAADSDGFAEVSTISVESYNGASINAFILLDLTDSYSELLADWAQSVTLFENLGTDPWGEDTEYFIQIGSVVLGVGEKYGNFSFDSIDDSNGSLVFNFTVPEPATYAAIFGALALVFAIWRRRK